jgi:hypothetical protein
MSNLAGSGNESDADDAAKLAPRPTVAASNAWFAQRLARANSRFDIAASDYDLAKALATLDVSTPVCDERAKERKCARTVDSASIRVRCGGSRADSYVPVSAERTLPIRVEGRGHFVAAP